MDEKRKRRNKEELIAGIDKKIEYHKKNIATLEAKKKAVLAPKPRKTPLSMNAILKKAKAQGLSAKDIAEKLHLDIDE